MLATFGPRLVYARDAARFERAFASDAVAPDAGIVVSEGTLATRPCESFAGLRATVPTATSPSMRTSPRVASWGAVPVRPPRPI